MNASFASSLEKRIELLTATILDDKSFKKLKRKQSPSSINYFFWCQPYADEKLVMLQRITVISRRGVT